jgi:hypothetical protein
MKALVKLAVVAAALVGTSSAPVSAAGKIEEQTTFYSDPSETTVVGWTIIYCDGSHIHTGSFSFYSETADFTC